MFLKSREARKLAMSSVVALSFLAAAGSAQAATQKLAYTCQYPLIGAQPLQISIDASIPTTVAQNQQNPAFNITAVATAGGDTGAGINLLGARSIEGTAKAAAKLAFPGGTTLPLGVPITIAKYNAPANSKANLVLNATGSTPPISFPIAGYTAVDVTDLTLNLVARTADGSAITELSGAQTIPATDNDPATFDVSCKVNSGQSTRLANIGVTDDSGSVPGTAPGPVAVNSLPAMTSPGTKIDYNYSLAGSGVLKTLVKGSLPLTGSAAANVTLASGAFVANLKLNRTAANLTALGFLPVRATVDIVPTAPTTGTLANGVLTAKATVRIKLPSVTLGGIQIAGGSTCRAKSDSVINLRSTDPFFYPLKGGTLAGAFAISDLVDCGFLTGIVSPLTAGSGNALALKLSPAA